MTPEHEDRRRASAVYFTRRQMVSIISAILVSIILGTFGGIWTVTKYVLRTEIREEVTEAILKHNGDATSHSTILERALASDEKVIHRLDDMRDKMQEISDRLSRIEGSLDPSLAGRTNGNGRSR